MKSAFCPCSTECFLKVVITSPYGALERTKGVKGVVEEGGGDIKDVASEKMGRRSKQA